MGLTLGEIEALMERYRADVRQGGAHGLSP